MKFEPGSAPEPIGGLGGPHEEHRVTRSATLAVGTLACPGCDAPVAPPEGRSAPSRPLACPFCERSGPLRDFLTLGEPTRPAHVVVRVRNPLRARA